MRSYDTNLDHAGEATKTICGAIEGGHNCAFDQGGKADDVWVVRGRGLEGR